MLAATDLLNIHRPLFSFLFCLTLPLKICLLVFVLGLSLWIICSANFPDTDSTHIALHRVQFSLSQWKDQQRLGGIIPIVLIWVSSLWDATKCTQWKGELWCSTWTPLTTNWLSVILTFWMAYPNPRSLIQIERDNLRPGKRWVMWFLSILPPQGSNMTNYHKVTLVQQKCNFRTQYIFTAQN